jgi:hypothetical protein
MVVSPQEIFLVIGFIVVLFGLGFVFRLFRSRRR